MGKLSTIAEHYRAGGLKQIGELVWVHALLRSPVAPVFKSLFGDIIYEKLNKYPRVGYWPQIREPRTFNEKLMYRKILTDNELYSKVSDKWQVREYVKKKVDDEVLNDVYYVTDDPATIPFEDLPDEFVIKATHGSGWNIIVDDKEQVNFESIRSQCSEWLSETYGIQGNEYWYSQIEPRIIIEKYLHDEEYNTPLDFKFWVFHGDVGIIEVDFDRFSNHKQKFYDKDWQIVDFTRKYPQGPDIDEPPRLNDMIDVAEKIGEDFDFVRIDLYNPNGEEILFGEMTLAPQSGGGRFTPTKYDFKFGSYW